MSQPQQNQKAVRNPEYDKATLGIWFPACQPDPITGAMPFQRIEINPPPQPEPLWMEGVPFPDPMPQLSGLFQEPASAPLQNLHLPYATRRPVEESYPNQEQRKEINARIQYDLECKREMDRLKELKNPNPYCRVRFDKPFPQEWHRPK